MQQYKILIPNITYKKATSYLQDLEERKIVNEKEIVTLEAEIASIEARLEQINELMKDTVL